MKAVTDLEWAELLDAIGDGCLSEQGGARIRALMPVDALEQARARMQTTAAALEALRLGEPVPGQPLPHIDAPLEHIEKGGSASGEDLRDVGRVLALSQALRSYADRQREQVPLLAELLSTDPSLDPLQAAISRAIDERGSVLDAASKALSSARQRAKSERRSLLDKLEQLMSRHADVLRDGSYVQRDGRYGIPVRSDAHRKVEGIVLGSSASGATLYVEPPSVTAIGNRLRLAEAEAEREEARVLSELSGRVQLHIELVSAAYQTCIEADVLAALSRWAERCKGIAVAVDDGHAIELEAMRHPLLVLQEGEVVANDLTLRAGQALVISGPNAGGKTVALKCLGLAVWMARAGLPIPAREPSKVGWFSRVLTDIGDDQSLSRSLSTFSAQVSNLSQMLRQADAHTLVLLDEVAGGTDPEEGSALAAAVLTALVTRGAAVAATTHYERLKDLAADAANAGDFVNASVAFDFDEMRPTFALTMGVPGASSALAVAKRFGMPDDVVAHAHSLLSQATIDREQLLAQLERERRALSEARSAAEQDAEQAEATRRELEAERRVVRRKERKKLADASAELVGQVRLARAKLRELEAQLEHNESTQALRDAERRIDEAARLVSVDGPLTKATREPSKRPQAAGAELRVGMQVYVERLGTRAQIVEAPERGEVKVQAGAFAIRVPLSELRLDLAPVKPKPKVYKPKPLPTPKDDGRALRTSMNTCNLRGQRVEEALEAMDRFIDELSRGPEPVGFVLHGHGTGALKKAVREHLKLSPVIARSRPANSDEGGDAFTVFWLR